MHYIIVLPYGTEIHRTCSLEGDTLADLVRSLSHFQLTHSVSRVRVDDPLFEITLVGSLEVDKNRSQGLARV